MTTPSNDACANCGAALRGEYCAACGQKRFVDADRRFGNVVRQFLVAATDLDGRFWGTIGALLFQPGRLSRDYIEGRRARWMSPMAVFLLVNLVYFISALQSDFATPFEWEVPGRIALEARDPGTVSAGDVERLSERPGPVHSRFTAPLVERRVHERDAATRAASAGQRGYDYRDYGRAYEDKVPEISKAMAIVHVPFLALALLVVLWRRRYYWAEHFIVALHIVAFYMATILVLGHGAGLVERLAPPADWHNALLNWSIRVVVMAYIVIALRRAYAIGWMWSTAAALGLIGAYILVNLHVYRPLLFLAVFALT